MQRVDTIATIIVTYNGAQWISKCMAHLQAVRASTTIIVVDNQSTDNTVDLLLPYMDDITFIQNDANLGFGAANNIGIKKALELGADYVFLLNQDAYLDAQCLDTLLRTSKKFPAFGILSPLQLNGSGQGLDAAFEKNLLRMGPFQWPPEPGKKDRKPIEVRFINAAAWFIPTRVIRQVGLFHPVFYHYGEDNHYAARVQFFKYKVGVVADATVIHDREQRQANQKYFVQALRTLPLIMLLDIRKPFPVAYLLGLHKLRRLRNKLRKLVGNEFDPLYREQKKWFNERLAEAKAIRRHSKKPVGL